MQLKNTTVQLKNSKKSLTSIIDEAGDRISGLEFKVRESRSNKECEKIKSEQNTKNVGQYGKKPFL